MWIRRGLVFGVVALHMQLGSALELGLGIEHPQSTMSWRMYSGVGRTVCQVRWLALTEEGPRPVDRLALVSPEKRRPPSRVRLLHGEEEVTKAARPLCRALGRDADVRAEAWCGTRRGWKRVFDGSEPLCSPR